MIAGLSDGYSNTKKCITSAARKALLNRLLALNQRATEEEVKKPVKADKVGKGKAVKTKKKAANDKQLGLGM